MIIKRFVPAACALALGVVLAACGGKAPGESASAAASAETSTGITAESEKAATVSTETVAEASAAVTQSGEETTVSTETGAEATGAEGASEAEEQTGDADADLDGKKWQDMAFSMDGKVYQIPFAYAGIKDQWTFNLSDYGYDKGYVLNPGDKVTGTIQLQNSRYSKVRCTAGFMNTGTEVKDILDTDI